MKTYTNEWVGINYGDGSLCMREVRFYIWRMIDRDIAIVELDGLIPTFVAHNLWNPAYHCFGFLYNWVHPKFNL